MDDNSQLATYLWQDTVSQTDTGCGDSFCDSMANLAQQGVGELAFRLAYAATRIDCHPPYSQAYILGQVSGGPGLWTNFPCFHGDIAGRWILAQTELHAGEATPPARLSEIVDSLLGMQQIDGSFGVVPDTDGVLNMHKMYGNGWLLKALASYAFVFKDQQAREAAVRLGRYYRDVFPRWAGFDTKEQETGFYAITRSCYFHALDGLVSLYKLTGDREFLALAGAFIPCLTPFDESDHAHMFLTIRRGLMEYYQETGDGLGMSHVIGELEQILDAEAMETGAVPERFNASSASTELFDEGCAEFDWYFCCMKAYEVTHDAKWLTTALIVLENAIYYNQNYNGGFGTFSFEPGSYKTYGKEAPWCCSLYGAWALPRIGASLVHVVDDAAVVLHAIDGVWSLPSGIRFSIVIDQKNHRIVCRDESPEGKRLKSVKLFLPWWLSVKDCVENEGFCTVSLDGDGSAVIEFSYSLWLSAPSRFPSSMVWSSGASAVVFHGPWLQVHRMKQIPCITSLDGSSEYLTGFAMYPQGYRISLPSTVKIAANDVFRGVDEKDGWLWMYAVKEKESPDGMRSVVLLA